MQLETQYMKKQTFSKMMTSTRQKLNRGVMYILSYLDIGVYPVHVHVFTLFEYIHVSAIGYFLRQTHKNRKEQTFLRGL